MMELSKRSSPEIPSAFSIEPSGNFADNDGKWSTFKLHVGSGSQGPQNFEAVVSTSSFTTWLPLKEGCVNEIQSSQYPGTSCPSTRGVGLFGSSPSEGYDGSRNPNAHKYGIAQGIKLGALGDAQSWFGNNYANISGEEYSEVFYFDSSTDSSAKLNSSTDAPILAVKSWMYYLTTIGLGFGKYEVTKANTPGINSTVSAMAFGGTIPSRSWGYTAGSQYDPKRLGSLTLGGYDTARLFGKPAQFSFDVGTSQKSELLVSVSSIAIAYTAATTKSEAQSPGAFPAIIDSTLPYLFLPATQCEWLAERLGLTYDDERNIYLINDTALASNKANVETLTIGIGSSDGTKSSTDSSIAITFPYEAFEATASWTWNFPKTQAIFPLRQAPGTAILGRVFFQEAYVSVDYETGQLNVSKASQDVPSRSDGIVTLYNTTTLHTQGSQHKTKPPLGAIIGGAIGGFVLLIVIALILWFYIKRKRQRKVAALNKGDSTLDEKSEHRPQATRERSDKFTSVYSNSTAVSELHSTELPRRPSHQRHFSELSSESEYSDRRGTAGTVGTLAYIDEMGHKSDAAELEGFAARNQQQDSMAGLTPPFMTPPSELEGSFRFPTGPTSPGGR